MCNRNIPWSVIRISITKKKLSSQTFTLSLGENYTLDFIDEVFMEYGFEKVDFVYEPGQYAMRGGIVDVFSFSSTIHIELSFLVMKFDSVRKFDPVSQLSVGRLTRATVVPNVGKKMLHESKESFFSFIPEDTVIWMHDVVSCESDLEKEHSKARAHYERLDGEQEHTPPEELYLDPGVFKSMIDDFRVVEFGGGTTFPHRLTIDFEMTEQPAFNKNFDMISSNLIANGRNGYVNVIVSVKQHNLSDYTIFSLIERMTHLTIP